MLGEGNEVAVSCYYCDARFWIPIDYWRRAQRERIYFFCRDCTFEHITGLYPHAQWSMGKAPQRVDDDIDFFDVQGGQGCIA